MTDAGQIAVLPGLKQLGHQERAGTKSIHIDDSWFAFIAISVLPDISVFLISETCEQSVEGLFPNAHSGHIESVDRSARSGKLGLKPERALAACPEFQPECAFEAG
jgi:hypothetical protein